MLTPGPNFLLNPPEVEPNLHSYLLINESAELGPQAGWVVMRYFMARSQLLLPESYRIKKLVQHVI
jgi:hypothetical protein